MGCIKVLNSARDLGAHIRMGCMCDGGTTTNRFNKAIQIAKRVKHMPLSEQKRCTIAPNLFLRKLSRTRYGPNRAHEQKKLKLVCYFFF